MVMESLSVNNHCSTILPGIPEYPRMLTTRIMIASGKPNEFFNQLHTHADDQNSRSLGRFLQISTVTSTVKGALYLTIHTQFHPL